MTGVLTKLGDVGTDTHRGGWRADTGRMAREDRGGGRNDASASPGTPRMDGWPPEAGEAGDPSLLQTWGGAQPCQPRDFGLLASRAVKGHMSVISNHQFLVLGYGSRKETNVTSKFREGARGRRASTERVETSFGSCHETTGLATRTLAPPGILPTAGSNVPMTSGVCGRSKKVEWRGRSQGGRRLVL